MKIITILIAKFLILMGKILHRGSSLPGKVALKINSRLLSELKYPSTRIIVTGSSGKGSTSSLIANTLRTTNAKVCHNSSGSNLNWGITTSILKDCNIFGRLKSDYLVLESDERILKYIIKDINPTYLIITNLTKDQPPRQHSVDFVYEQVCTNIPSTTTIITNEDDPYLRALALDLPNPIITYGLAQNKYSYQESMFENLITYHCPYCHSFLTYDYYNFEILGGYSCPNCDFFRRSPKYEATNIDLDKQTLTIENQTLSIGGDMLYNAYNTLSAYTVLRELNIKSEDLKKHFQDLNISKNSKFMAHNLEFIPFSSKAENSSTFNQSLFKILTDNRPKSIIIGWKEISRRYQHFDLSWLYDISFELLNKANVKKIYACGIDSKNIKQRLILADIKEDLIVTSDDILMIKDQVLNDEVEVVYGVLNFDYMLPFISTFKEDKND